MELRSDILLKGEDWFFINETMSDNKDKKKEARILDYYFLAIAIGIKNDKVLEDEGSETTASISRNTIMPESGKLSYLFKTAILTTNTVSFNNSDRAYLAFSEELSGEEVDEEEREQLKKGITEEALKFNKIQFLRGFANYGAKEIVKLYDSNDTNMMQNLINYLEALYEE